MFSYDLALGLLPVALAFFMSFSLEAQHVNLERDNHHAQGLQSENGGMLCVALVTYISLVFIVVGLRVGAEQYTRGKRLSTTTIFGYAALILLGVASAFVDKVSASPLVQFLAALAVAACITLISQHVLMLPEEYRVAAKSSPPLSRESWIRRYALRNFVLAAFIELLLIRYYL